MRQANKSHTMKKILSFATILGTSLMGLAAHAQTLPDSFTVTAQLTFADTYLAAMYSTGAAYAPFIVALLFLLIVVGIVSGVFRSVFRWIKGLGQ